LKEGEEVLQIFNELEFRSCLNLKTKGDKIGVRGEKEKGGKNRIPNYSSLQGKFKKKEYHNQSQKN